MDLNEGGTDAFTAKNIIIATGSEPASLPGVEVDEKVVVTSTGARELGKAAKDAPVIRMNEPGGFFEAIGLARARGAAATTVPARIELDVADRLLPRLQPGLPYLLPEFLVP